MINIRFGDTGFCRISNRVFIFGEAAYPQRIMSAADCRFLLKGLGLHHLQQAAAFMDEKGGRYSYEDYYARRARGRKRHTSEADCREISDPAHFHG